MMAFVRYSLYISQKTLKRKKGTIESRGFLFAVKLCCLFTEWTNPNKGRTKISL